MENKFKNNMMLGISFSIILAASGMSCQEPSSSIGSSDLIDQETQSQELFNAETVQGEMPSFTFIFSREAGGNCQGTRIAPDVLITAGHCLRANTQASRITLARVNRNNQEQVFPDSVTDFIIHPRYNEALPKIQLAEEKIARREKVKDWDLFNPYDIAIVKLNPSKLPKFQDNVVKIFADKDLNDDLLDYTYVNKILTYYVWSYLDHYDFVTQRTHNKSRKKMTITEGPDFGYFFGYYRYISAENKPSICRGDSGAGLLVPVKNASGNYYFAGVASVGASKKYASSQCFEQGLFVPISPELGQWIKKETGIK
jgi:hypothetical protein